MTARVSPSVWVRSVRSPERGSAAVETAIVGGAFIIGFFALMLVAGRIVSQENQVRSAAQAAARDASLQASYAEAGTVVAPTVQANLLARQLTCDNLNVQLISSQTNFDVDRFVTVEVTCVARSASPILGVPDNTWTYTATEVIDQFRGDP